MKTLEHNIRDVLTRKNDQLIVEEINNDFIAFVNGVFDRQLTEEEFLSLYESYVNYLIEQEASMASKIMSGAKWLGRGARFVPGIQTAAGLGLAGYRALQGDYKGAGLSLGSAIPGPVGYGFAAADIARELKGDNTSTADTAADVAGGVAGAKAGQKVLDSATQKGIAPPKAPPGSSWMTKGLSAIKRAPYVGLPIAAGIAGATAVKGMYDNEAKATTAPNAPPASAPPSPPAATPPPTTTPQPTAKPMPPAPGEGGTPQPVPVTPSATAPAQAPAAAPPPVPAPASPRATSTAPPPPAQRASPIKPPEEARKKPVVTPTQRPSMGASTGGSFSQYPSWAQKAFQGN